MNHRNDVGICLVSLCSTTFLSHLVVFFLCWTKFLWHVFTGDFVMDFFFFLIFWLLCALLFFILSLLSKAIFAGYKRCCLDIFLHTLFLERNLWTFAPLCMEHPLPLLLEQFKHFIAQISINLCIFLKVDFVVLNVSCAWSSLRASDLRVSSCMEIF